MHASRLRFLVAFFFVTLVLPLTVSAQLQETWATGYKGKDATGSSVIGYWTFDGDTPETALRDVSGKGHDLTIGGGGVLNPEGKFGGCFESFPGFPVQDKRHAVLTPHHPSLSPTGAFTLEMWISPKEEFEPRLRSFLLDKKYVDDTDYQWFIGTASPTGLRRMSVGIGFGSKSHYFSSDLTRFETGIWYHVAFTYDGAGEGRFYINGQSAGVQKYEGIGAPVSGKKALSIGDRLGSNYGGFPGFIDEVRISNGVLLFEPVGLELSSSRTVLRRMEDSEGLQILCTNYVRGPLKGATLSLSWSNDGGAKVISLPELAQGETKAIPFSLDTSLKPGDYLLQMRLEIEGEEPFVTERSASFTITPRPVRDRMPVIMWGLGTGGLEKEVDRLREIGFTHSLGMRADYQRLWEADENTLPEAPEKVEENIRILDLALKNDLSFVTTLSPKSWLINNPKNLRVDREGKPYEREDIDASMPEFPPYFRRVGESVSKAYGKHPAFSMGLVSTEVRDSSRPSFNQVDIENYRAFSGQEIPKEVDFRGGVDWTKLADFPADRVVPDDHPILKYYRWFWTVGDGWNELHTALSDGLKAHSHSDFRTFFDPAVRQPSISGSGGNVDLLSHWTYTYPDPQRIGMCADQLFAMAEASGKKQEVMKMTQIIWYRTQTAPITTPGKKSASPPPNPVAWEDHDPEAAYITISPMHLREALWTKLARPIRGIMYHGWQSLVDTDSTSSYRYTNPHTRHELKRLIHEVVEPLGPTLLNLPGIRSDVAFFESFTSQIFGRRGGYGSNMGWSADLWMALQHAHIQADIIFEETLLKDGLKGRRFLVMPEAVVLPASVVKAIKAWQQEGGKIIADEDLCPALKADLVVKSTKRIRKADTDKAAVLAIAKQLGPDLAALGLVPAVSCDNPEVILRTRRAGEGTYLFAINDHREFGNYVGQHGLVMENGLPSSTAIQIPNTATTRVYNLVEGTEVPLVDGAIPLSLGPCDGALLLALPKAIGDLSLELPETAKLGKSVTVAVSLKDEAGAPLAAVIPARLEIRDSNGRLSEGSGYYAIQDGSLSLTLDLASNDDPGSWQISVQELASRKKAIASLRVEKSSPKQTAK